MEPDAAKPTILPDLASSPTRLAMRDISKRFGGVHALRNVSFEASAGEVHALCGENGAGKSTLMKILAGAMAGDEGEILLNGRSVRFDNPRQAEAAGVRIIHQELNLVPELTVAGNIFLGRETTRGWGWLNDRAMEREALRLFRRLGAEINPRDRVGDLRIGDQQMVEIAKALAFDARIFIMDEPTSALSDAEVARLFRVIEDLRRNGETVIYISHKMNEIFTLADRVTVLRDGQHVATAQRGEIRPDQVVRWMVGREIASFSFEDAKAGSTALEVRDLCLPSPPDSGRPALRNIDLDLRGGEVLGIAGLLGAGRTELLEALFGASSAPPSGSIMLNGVRVRFRNPGQAIAAGVAFVTEDRKNLGLFDQMSVGENITICRLREIASLGWIRGAKENQAVNESIQRLSIKTRSGDAPVLSLSGGNQQKCILARWLLTEPRVLLLDEPTRGIDVGAKAEIYALMRRLAQEGMAIMMTSSELPELLTVCDRIMVLCEGRKTAEFPREQADEEVIMTAATQFLDRARLGVA